MSISGDAYFFYQKIGTAAIEHLADPRRVPHYCVRFRYFDFGIQFGLELVESHYSNPHQDASTVYVDCWAAGAVGRKAGCLSGWVVVGCYELMT